MGRPDVVWRGRLRRKAGGIGHSSDPQGCNGCGRALVDGYFFAEAIRQQPLALADRGQPEGVIDT